MSRPLNPQSVEDLTTAWFDAALSERYGRVVGSRVLQVMHGTATKIQVALELKQADGSVASRTVWVKTGLEAHSHSIGQESVYAGEVYYYQHLDGHFPTYTPEILYSHFEPDTDTSVLVMEDLLARGVVFSDATVALSPETVDKGLTTIAGYQAASWNHPLVLGDKHLMSGGVLCSGRIEDWMFDPANWAEKSGRPRFKAVPPALRDVEVWSKAHSRVLRTWWKVGPRVLAHGDAHIGQTYLTPEGQVRFLDWQCCMAASWAADFAYFLTTSLDPADRRATEGDLLKAHLKRLADAGKPVPDFDSAWAMYRACALYGGSWALCKVEMQSEDNCTAIAARTMAAVVDLKSLEAVEATPPALTPA